SSLLLPLHLSSPVLFPHPPTPPLFPYTTLFRSMSVLPEQLLQDSGARDIKEMQSLVSGLSVSSTSSESQTTVRIRGVGTVGDNPGLESSVGVVIDGVYRPRNGVGFGDLGPVERIEVLKGPQG